MPGGPVGLGDGRQPPFQGGRLGATGQTRQRQGDGVGLSRQATKPWMSHQVQNWARSGRLARRAVGTWAEAMLVPDVVRHPDRACRRHQLTGHGPGLKLRLPGIGNRSQAEIMKIPERTA
jgi:hypothetical protein